MRRYRLILVSLLLGLSCLARANSGPPAPSARPLKDALLAKQPAGVLAEDLAAAMVFSDRTAAEPPARAAWSPAGVLRVENFARPKFADHVNASWAFREAARRGDVMLARFFARAEYARQESGEALFEFVVKQKRPDWTAHVKLPLTAGPDWALLEIPFVMTRDAEAGAVTVNFGFGTIPQAVEIAGLEVLNFGKKATIAELPQTRFSYRGREAGAAWREAALTRIEQHRTAPVALRVIDAAGKPVAGARIEARLVRPAFLWATAVDAKLIVADTPEAARYREALLAHFDGAVIGNGFKWPKWSGGVAGREEALRASEWIEARGLRQRGHTLVWPGDKFSPRRVVAMPPPREGLSSLVREHIRDLLTATRGRMEAWDVVNELMHERDYFKYMPETEAAEWFKVAREMDPRAQLFINDYGMLNSRKSPETIAAYVDLVRRLRAAGAPIDAMGVQGHIGRQVRAPEDVLSDLALLDEAGLELQITEFDINTTDEELQADYTRDFLIALYSHPSVTGFTIWGFWEKDHWKPDAAMLRADFSEKPNAKVWRELVRGAWRTRAELVSDAAGAAATRGHLGDYEFTVTSPQGKVLKQMRPLGRDGLEAVLQFP